MGPSNGIGLTIEGGRGRVEGEHVVRVLAVGGEVMATTWVSQR